jgi:hypothetical protein
MPQYQRVVELIGLAAAVAWVAAACSSSSSSSTLLTKEQAADVSQGLAFDVEDEIVDAAATGSVTTFTDAPAVGLTSTVQQCTVTRSPTNPDTAVTGVPDSVSLSFNNCVISYAGAVNAFPETDTLQGTVVIEDPTPTVVNHNEVRIYQELERIRERVGTSGTVRSTETWNGTRTMTRDSTNLTEQETAFVTAFALPDSSAPTHTRTWTSKFVADVAGSITADHSLPSGMLTISGEGTWAVGGTTYNVSVATAGLHYNASCTATPRFDSGTLTATVTLTGSTGTVTVTFGGCGVVSASNS